MARQTNRLNARAVATLTRPGRHADGGNLYLIVDKGGAKRWAFLFRQEGKLREMGLAGSRRYRWRERVNWRARLEPLSLTAVTR